MLLLDRLFGFYYFVFVKLRKINKPDDEDFGAVCMIVATIILVVGLLFAIVKVYFNIQTEMLSLSGKAVAVVVMLLTLYIFYSYYVKNRIRRRRVIEEYRSLSSRSKMLWSVIAVSLIVIPQILFPILL